MKDNPVDLMTPIPNESKVIFLNGDSRVEYCDISRQDVHGKHKRLTIMPTLEKAEEWVARFKHLYEVNYPGASQRMKVYSEIAVMVGARPVGSFEVIHPRGYNHPNIPRYAGLYPRITAINWNGLVAVNVLTLRLYDGDIRYFEKAYLFTKSGGLVTGVKLDRDEYHRREFGKYKGYVLELISQTPCIDISFIDLLVANMPSKLPRLLNTRGRSLARWMDKPSLIGMGENERPYWTNKSGRSHVTVEDYSEFVKSK